MAAINKGTACIYGIAGTVTNLFVQSYSISSSFNSEAMVVDESGITKTQRLDDRKSEITLEGVAKTATVPVLGANLTFTVNTASAYGTSAGATFTGVITKVDDKGSSQGFTSVSVTAVSYEGVTYSSGA
jgi:hypothetical protein